MQMRDRLKVLEADTLVGPRAGCGRHVSVLHQDRATANQEYLLSPIISRRVVNLNVNISPSVSRKRGPELYHGE